jgi:hypothetical protein
MEETSVLPTKIDILCGKGNAHHPGNRRFRRIVADHNERYPATVTKHDKMKVSKMILDEVMSRGGRFLRMDPIRCKWYVADWMVVKNKISLCLRDIKGVLRDKRRQHPVSRAQVLKEPTIGGQPHQKTALWGVPFQEMLVGHQEHQQMLPSSIVDIKNCQRRNSEPYPATVCVDMYPIWDQQMLPSSIVDIKNCQRRNSEPYPATVCVDMYPIWDQQMLPSSIVDIKHCQRRNSEPYPATVCDDIYPLLSSPSMGDMNPHSIFPPEPLQDSTINIPSTVCNEIDPFLSNLLKACINPRSVDPPESQQDSSIATSSWLTLDDVRELEHILTPSQQECQESETHSGAMGTSKRIISETGCKRALFLQCATPCTQKRICRVNLIEFRNAGKDHENYG